MLNNLITITLLLGVVYLVVSNIPAIRFLIQVLKTGIIETCQWNGDKDESDSDKTE